MDRQTGVEFGWEELQKLDSALSILAEMKQDELLSLCREIVDSAFPDSVGHAVVEVLLRAGAPLCLREIAAKCGRGKRSILPDGNIRAVLERLVHARMVINQGTPDKPRYLFDRSDRRVQALVRMYGRFASEGRKEGVPSSHNVHH